ncbi:sugar ABC transporter substrate-binding protein [Humibacter sp. RRB41]|uniref:ABC transporter substrate-binding protein n=1 Tax=Humibacter sp. RRB41 TaxID=2919946 RepID=UPI001FA95047|nr:extracellular solute-binding protein [Humibacter sp. RRB41]
MDRRSFLSLAALSGVGLGLGATLVGCSSDSSGSGSQASAYTPPAKSLKATISYAIWDVNQQPAMEKIIKGFNKIYPNVTVNIQLTPSAGGAYWTKMKTLASGKNLPDVLWMNGPNIQLFALNNQLMPIDSLVSAGQIKKSNYPSALVNLYTVDGRLYGTPKDFDTVGLYYNKDMLGQAGAAVPTSSWTWDDLKTNGKKVSDHFGKGVFGFAGDLTGGQTSWYNTMLQGGGYIISSNHKKSGYDLPGSIKGLQFWADIIAAGISPSMQQLTTTLANDWFTSGKLAMVMDGDWETAPYHQAFGDKLGVVQLPKGPKSNQSVIHGLGNVISATTKEPEAALAFVSYLGGKPPALLQADAGVVIPAFNGSQTVWANSIEGLDLQLFLDEAKVASPYPISKNTSAWNQMESDILPAAFAGQTPVATAAKKLAEQMNAELAKD